MWSKDNFFWQGRTPTALTEFAVYCPYREALVEALYWHNLQITELCKGWNAKIVSNPPAAIVELKNAGIKQ